MERKSEPRRVEILIILYSIGQQIPSVAQIQQHAFSAQSGQGSGKQSKPKVLQNFASQTIPTKTKPPASTQDSKGGNPKDQSSNTPKLVVPSAAPSKPEFWWQATAQKPWWQSGQPRSWWQVDNATHGVQRFEVASKSSLKPAVTLSAWKNPFGDVNRSGTTEGDKGRETFGKSAKQKKLSLLKRVEAKQKKLRIFNRLKRRSDAVWVPRSKSLDLGRSLSRQQDPWNVGSPGSREARPKRAD